MSEPPDDARIQAALAALAEALDAPAPDEASIRRRLTAFADLFLEGEEPWPAEGGPSRVAASDPPG